VLDELVVTEELSIATEKVTEMLSLIETPPWLSVGEIDSTVGDVVSVVVVLSVVVLSVVVLSVVVLSVAEYSSFSSLQEMTVRLKQEIRKMNKNFFIFSSIPKVKYYCFVY
jgi:cytochrome c-type biogenesis protein CcmH/NrfG